MVNLQIHELLLEQLHGDILSLFWRTASVLLLNLIFIIQRQQSSHIVMNMETRNPNPPIKQHLKTLKLTLAEIEIGKIRFACHSQDKSQSWSTPLPKEAYHR